MIPDRTLAALLLAFSMPALAVAQGLGDAAAKERQRRQRVEHKQSAPAPVYSNADLPKSTGASSGETAGSEAAAEPAAAAGSETEALPPAEQPASGESAAPEPTLEQKHQAREQEFEQAVNAARARVAELEAHFVELRNKLNPMSVTFIYGPTGSRAFEEEAKVRAELQQEPARMAEVQAAVAAAERALDDFRNGRPDAVPGGAPPRQ